MIRQFLLIAIVCCFYFNTNAQTVTVYQDTGFKGLSKTTNGSWQTMEAGWDNKIRSAIIPEGYKLRLFLDADFHGTFTEVAGRWTLTDEPSVWKDAISSFMIMKKAPIDFVVYTRPNFSGNSKVFHENTASLDNEWDGNIASIRVPPGYRLSIFQETNYGGASKAIEGFWSVKKHGSEAWKGKIRSFQLYEKKTNQVILYENANFEGKQIVFHTNVPKLSHEWDNNVSSIRVPDNYQMMVFTEPNYQGESTVIAGNWTVNSSNAKWNDNISSFKLIKVQKHSEKENE